MSKFWRISTIHMHKDPGLSILKLAVILEMSEFTACPIVYQDFRHVFYDVHVKQIFFENAKVKKLARCDLLCSLYNETTKRIRI